MLHFLLCLSRGQKAYHFFELSSVDLYKNNFSLTGFCYFFLLSYFSVSKRNKGKVPSLVFTWSQ